MKGIFLLLGSNIGDRKSNLTQAINLIQNSDIFLNDYSSVYETAPWGNEKQEWFLNIVIRIETMHAPNALLEICQGIENQIGRKRLEKWGSRTIDIDILYYDNVADDNPILIIPHPGIALRRFTLLPLVEIAAKEIHPILNVSQEKLLDICPDKLQCNKLDMDLAI